MKLRLTAHGIHLSAGLEDYVRQRLHFRLGRFAGNIRHVSVRLADCNGPRGGVDQCCDIRVDLGLPQPVIVHERQVGIHAAVAFAAERVERAVRRQLSLAGEDRAGRNLRLEAK